MSPEFDAYMPVHRVMMEIERLWRACKIDTISFEQFCDSGPAGELRWFLELNDATLPSAAKRPPHYIDRFVRIWKNLASAVACCQAARDLSEKPLRGLLLQAMEHCRAVEAMQADLAEKLADIHAARVKGGKARQAALDPARQEAARLLTVYRPATGWPTPNAAAKTIVDDLRRFILCNRLSMVAGDHLVKTIVGWIDRVTIVRAAFNGDR